MSNHKATDEQWDELRARVEALEAQANHIPGATKMVSVARVTQDRDETGNYVIVHDTATPPPVATDEKLNEAWDTAGAGGTYSDCLRTIYDLGIKHGQARRPKPPSLKEQALAALNEIEDKMLGPTVQEKLIRRALEQLND
jgi:hypothetical protein